MKSAYRDKVIQALSLAETMDDILLIEDKIRHSQSINRRTNEGRELTKQLLELCWNRWVELFGDVPFN
jgi:hypothetical protein